MKPVSTTAFYCCGVRMDDARSSMPVCGDVYAQRFMNDEGLRVYAQFRGQRKANASNVARARIIDDWLRGVLASAPDTQVVLIGAGFDSRAYRLGAGRWLEFDEPALLDYKNARLPVSECPRPLQRIAIDFATESLADKLAPFASGQPAVFVIEGVFEYLPEAAIRQTLAALKHVFPQHRLIGDLMTRRFIDTYGGPMLRQLNSLGADFVRSDEPASIFTDEGYRLVDKISAIERAIDLGLTRVPKFIVRHLLRTLSQGYAVHVFVTPA